MTTTEKVRDALWRYAPERTEGWATKAVIIGVTLAGVANWLRKGQYK